MAAGAFWISLVLLAFTFAGYPLLISILARIRSRRDGSLHTPHNPPSVAVVLVAYNEATRITARIHNLLASDYPPGLLTIVVVSDGSTDETEAALGSLQGDATRLIVLPVRKGKPAGLNAGVAAADAEIIVFTDARQTFAPDTIAKLTARFADPSIGAVSGELEIAPAQSTTGAGVDAYWRLERFLRSRESEWDSCIGCTGACYAIRRTLFTPLPEDTILDDVVIPMRIAISGYRVIHESSARAFDPQPLEPASESRRKRRTLAGNFQMLFRHPAWLLPSRNRLWWQLITHKYLRLAAPLLLAALLASSIALATHPLYRAALLLQIAFYLLAALGMATPLRHRALSIPAGFVFLNLTIVRAFWHYLTTADPARWQPPAR